MALEKKPVSGYEDQYYIDPETMTIVNKKTGRVRKVYKNSMGYATINLWKNNHGQTKDMHRLVAEAYLPNPLGLPEVNHKDENPMNYSLDNLEWCDHKYNMNYGSINERRGAHISEAKKGKPQPWIADIKSIPIYAIDEYGSRTRYRSAAEAARELNLDRSHITAVLKGRMKTHGGYRFRYADD